MAAEGIWTITEEFDMAVLMLGHDVELVAAGGVDEAMDHLRGVVGLPPGTEVVVTRYDGYEDVEVV